MIKIFISLVLLSSMMLSATLGKATGCDLSQDGDVSINIVGYASTKKAIYIPAQDIGKNFKELFVGSTIKIKDAVLSIISISSNKRVKDGPRTGELTVTLTQTSHTQDIKMSYRYLNGFFEANGKQKNSKDISFSLNIKALLCYNK